MAVLKSSATGILNKGGKSEWQDKSISLNRFLEKSKEMEKAIFGEHNQ